MAKDYAYHDAGEEKGAVDPPGPRERQDAGVRYEGPQQDCGNGKPDEDERADDLDPEHGRHVPLVPDFPVDEPGDGVSRGLANVCGFSIFKEAEKFLGRVTYGADSGWLLSFVDVSADDALPPFHSGGDSTRGYRRGAKYSRGRKRGRLRGPHEVARGLGYRVARHVR